MKKDEKYKISNKYKISVAYSAIKQRCYNPKCKAYKNYGARGIKMCQEWFDNPILFYEWAMKNGYCKGLEIDRINNDGDYEPNNCRWVSHIENNNNRRGCKYIEFNSQIHTISQWADILGFNKSVLYSRLFEGWSIEKALTTPINRNMSRVNNKKICNTILKKYGGEYESNND